MCALCAIYLVPFIVCLAATPPGNFMSAVTVQFEFEKETKNSVRYKEVAEEGKAPIVGTLYVQKWFAGSSKSVSISITKND